MQKKDIINHTKRWIEQVVIGLELCPFAHVPYSQGRVQIKIIQANHMAEWIKALLNAYNYLLDTPAEVTSNILLIFPNGVNDFDAFLDLYDMAEIILRDQNLQAELQLASFHPLYQFAHTEKDDITNYTNRSPYPMIHILRSAEVEAAIAHHPNIESIPTANQETMRRLGIKHMIALLK